MLEIPGEGVNLQESVVFCENLRLGLGLSASVCHLQRALKIHIARLYPGQFRVILLGKATQIDKLPNGQVVEQPRNMEL